MRARLLLLIPLLVFGGVACSDDDGDGGDGGEGGTSTTAADGDEAQTVIEVSNFKFTPADVTAADGATIVVRNESDTPHTFTVDGLDIDEEIAGGEEVTVTADGLTAEEAFYCRFHRSGGMEGTLTPAG